MNPIQHADLRACVHSAAQELTVTFRNGYIYRSIISDVSLRSNPSAPSTYVVNVPGEIGTVELTVYWSSANIFCYSRRERRSYEFRFSVSTDSSSTTDYSVRSGGINTFSEYIFADTHEQYWRDDSGYRDTNTANLRNNMRVTPEDGSLIREFKSRKKIKRNLPEWF